MEAGCLIAGGLNIGVPLPRPYIVCGLGAGGLYVNGLPGGLIAKSFTGDVFGIMILS
jgi:hypothetical protein